MASLKTKFDLIIGIVLFSIGICMLVFLHMFAPYCATHICGCTGQGEQWMILQPLGAILIIVGTLFLFSWKWEL